MAKRWNGKGKVFNENKKLYNDYSYLNGERIYE